MTYNFQKPSLIPLCQSNQSYLRARGLFCIKTFSEAKLKKATIIEVFKISMALLTSTDEQDMPVQVEAAMALSRLASEHESKANAFMKENVGKILEVILELTSKTAHDDLLDVIKQFIADFDEEIVPVAEPLARKICDSFINMAGNTDESDEDHDNKCLTAVGMLTTLETLLDILEDNEQLVTAVENVVTEVIAWVLQNRKMDYYEEALSILSSVTTHHITDNVWPALPLLQEILENTENGGVEYFIDMMPALHNYWGDFG